MTTVVNIKSGAEYDVYCGRKGKGQDGYFGNPFPVKAGQNRGSSLEMYREYFYNRLATDPEFKQKIHALKGKILACFCTPSPCHVDIIKEYLDNMKPMKIIIAGGRDFDDYNMARLKLNNIILPAAKDNEIIIVSGACSTGKHTFTRPDGTKVYGADGIGEKYAEEYGFEVEIYPADWDIHGRSAGYKRNLVMGEVGTHAVCFWDKKSKGTKSMINIATDKKLVLRVINY